MQLGHDWQSYFYEETQACFRLKPQHTFRKPELPVRFDQKRFKSLQWFRGRSCVCVCFVVFFFLNRRVVDGLTDEVFKNISDQYR